MKRLKDIVLNLVYPPVCVICFKGLGAFSKDILYEDCRKQLSYINPKNACKICGVPFNDGCGEICTNCKKRFRYFKSGFAAFPYEYIKKAVFDFKFNGYFYDGKALAKLMYDYAVKYHADEFADIDVVTAVPMFKKKEKRRGFNQSAILAKNLCFLLNKPFCGDMLKRTRQTAPQKDLTAHERAANILGAFSVLSNEKVKDKNILIIDDIFTTGSTINECARMLIKAGARSVRFFTLAIAQENQGKDSF